MGTVAAIEALHVCNELDRNATNPNVERVPRDQALPVALSSFGPGELCHPVSAREPFTREGWIFELKHDGFRAFVRKGRTGVQLLSRRGRSMARAFPELVEALSALSGDAVLDGELIVPDDDGLGDFEETRRRALLQRPRAIEQAAARRPAVLVLFDVLEIDGDALRERPLSERRSVLQWCVAPMSGLQLIQHVETHGEALFSVIVEHDQEGIVAKRLDAPYRAGRQPTWIKIKNRQYSRREALEWRG